MKITSISLLVILSFFACSKSTKVLSVKNDTIDSKSKNTISNSPVDSSSVVLKIERGAFHYDKFILEDTVLTYYPSSEKLEKKYDMYNHISKQIISKETRNNLIKYIINNGVFDLKDTYPCEASCSSNLTVTFTFNNRSKKIISEDFKYNCPELLQYIEKEIVRLHNKNLKRILLPG